MRLFSIAMTSLLAISCSTTDSKQSAATIETKEIAYQVDGKKHIGYLAKPAKTESPLPAVLVVHEWWGQTDYPRKRARMLAELGYVAMAVDMYGDRQIANHPKDAQKFASQVMGDASTLGQAFRAAFKTLQNQDTVDGLKIAAIGYCFGGSVVLEAAKQGLDLEAVVSFHGGLKTPTAATKNTIEANILVLNGAEDSFVSKQAIKDFKASMRAVEADFQFVNLPDAKHGFTNPEATANGKKFGIPLAYNEQADSRSWKLMKEFLEKHLD